jgi:hypothetical protein
VLSVSSRLWIEGDIVAIMHVFVFPPSESLNSLVSLLSLEAFPAKVNFKVCNHKKGYGTWPECYLFGSTYMEHDQNAQQEHWSHDQVWANFYWSPLLPLLSPAKVISFWMKKFRLWKLTNISFKPLYWLWRNSKAWSCRNYKRYLCGWCIKPTEGKANGSVPGCIRIR